MKISLITTVFNEEKGISALIESMLLQTKKADEIVIVDGGSKDETLNIIKKYQKKHSEIKLIKKVGANIAEGRNIAIKNATYDIIAATDGGCVLDINWLYNITKPFNDDGVFVVSGGFKPSYKNDFEYFQGLIVCKSIESLNEKTFLPSGRSIAFRKKAWNSVGGYPEAYYTGEDTLFDLELKKRYDFYFAKDAIVFWNMRSTWKKFAKQFYLYGFGDMKTGNIFLLKKNLLFFFVSVMYSLLLLFFFDYFLYLLVIPIFFSLLKGLKLFKLTKKINAIYYGFLLEMIKRGAYILGFFVALIHKLHD